jgi:hypothetical protein
MRKLLWYVVLSLVAFVGAQSSAGCGGGGTTATFLCNGACLDYNVLKCGTTCDCNACVVAPPACDEYFSCIQTFSGSCLQLLIQCPIPAQCQLFLAANCK